MSTRQKPKNVYRPGILADLNLSLKLTITVGSVAVIVMILTIIGYCSVKDFSQQKAKEEAIEFGVRTVATGFAIISATYVGESVRSVAKAQLEEESLRKVDRSLKLIERWNNPSFNPILTEILEVRTVLEESNSHDPRQVPFAMEKELNQNPSLMTKTKFILNFLEEVATAVNEELVDEKIIKDYFRFILENYDMLFGPWIITRRQEVRVKMQASAAASDDIYRNLCKLTDKWKQQDENAFKNT